LNQFELIKIQIKIKKFKIAERCKSERNDERSRKSFGMGVEKKTQNGHNNEHPSCVVKNK
jgi:hypothetical protein